MARSAESSVRGRACASSSRDLRLASSSACTQARALAAACGPSAFTVMMRSFGPALAASAVASPACSSNAWFAGVPMNRATSRTPDSLRTCAEIRMSTTESW